MKVCVLCGVLPSLVRYGTVLSTLRIHIDPNITLISRTRGLEYCGIPKSITIFQILTVMLLACFFFVFSQNC